MILRVCALYPELMNIYADRGNLLMLEHRALWRGIEWRLCASSLGEPLRDEHDLYYIGGGQDADQRRCAAGQSFKRDQRHVSALRRRCHTEPDIRQDRRNRGPDLCPCPRQCRRIALDHLAQCVANGFGPRIA